MLVPDKSAAEIFREIEYEEAFREGKAEGFAKAEKEITEKYVLKLLPDFDLKTISEMLEIDLSKVKEIAEKQ